MCCFKKNKCNKDQRSLKRYVHVLIHNNIIKFIHFETPGSSFLKNNSKVNKIPEYKCVILGQFFQIRKFWSNDTLSLE